MFKKTHIKSLLGSILIGSMAAVSTPAMANNEAMMDLLKVLRDKGSISQAEYEVLANAAKADAEKSEGAVSEIKADVDKKLKDVPTMNAGDGKIEWKQGDNSIRLTGRLHWDTTWTADEGNFSGNSEQQFRRARIGIRGTLAKVWDFKFEYDLEDAEDTDQAIEDAYIKYKGWPVKITGGQRRTAYGMSEFVSSNKMPFIERSFASDLFHNASTGVGGRAMGLFATYEFEDVFTSNGHILTEASYTTLRIGSNSVGIQGESNFDNGHGANGRLVFSDYDKKAQTLIQVGVSGGQKSYANETVGRFRIRPNVSEGDRIVDSDGAIAADSYESFNLHAAVAYKQFWANGEYFHGSFDLTTPGTIDDEMEGYFIQAGYYLTPGDSRPYKPSAGSWSTVKPKNPMNKGGWGALEVAARYDHADLGAGIGNDQASAFTAALNWYPLSNLRLQANYVRVFCDAGECDWDSGTTSASEPDYFVTRVQVFF